MSDLKEAAAEKAIDNILKACAEYASEVNEPLCVILKAVGNTLIEIHDKDIVNNIEKEIVV